MALSVAYHMHDIVKGTQLALVVYCEYMHQSVVLSNDSSAANDKTRGYTMKYSL